MQNTPNGLNGQMCLFLRLAFIGSLKLQSVIAQPLAGRQIQLYNAWFTVWSDVEWEHSIGCGPIS